MTGARAAGSAPTPRRIDVDSLATQRIYVFLALLPFAVGALSLLGSESVVSGLLAITAMTFLPGVAVLTMLPRLPIMLRIGVAAAISLSIFAIGSTILIAASWFKPWLLIWLVMLPSSVVLARRVQLARRRTARRASDRAGRKPPRIDVGEPIPRREVVFRWLLGAGWILWLASMPSIDVEGMTDLGLLTQFPPTWYMSILVVAVGGAVYAMRPGVRAWTMAAFVGSLIAMIYSTTPLLYDLPHYQWVYKHVGVTLQFMDVGVLLPSADLYNRWPGMFALGATFSRFAGYADPLEFIAWAEFYFIALQTLIVSAIAMGEQRKFGIGGLAAIIFVLLNWIGQGYYSPQGLTFTLQLTIIAVLFSQLSARGNALGRFTITVLRWLTRRQQTWTLAIQRTDWPAAVAVGFVVLVDVAMTMSHQLTPYIMLMQAGLLWVCGFIRPRWVILIFALVPILYIAPMIGWVDEHYGIFSSLDPFNNIKVAETVELDCKGGCKTVSLVTLATSLIGWLGGIASIFIVARRRPSFRVPFFAIGMLSPFLMVLGQDYGGEAGLRLVMFCAPFGAILMATAIASYGPRLRMVLTIGLTTVLTFGFLVAYFGNEHNYRVTRAELDTARYYFDNARRGSVFIATVPNFPQLASSRYASFARNYGGGMPVIYENPDLRRLDKLGPKQVEILIDDIASYARTGYFTISDEQIRYSESLGLSAPGQLENFERALLDSGYFELWYENDGNRIYRLKGTTESVARDQERKAAAKKRADAARR